jgi:hypothetical protein
MLIKNKMHIAAILFATDMMLSVWSYFQLSNYNEFLKIAKLYTNNPEIFEQIYHILLQGFIVILLSFNCLHLFIYWLYTRHHKFVTKYMHFYTALAALSSLILMGTGNFVVGILSFCSYAFNFYAIKRLNRV